MSFPQWKGLWDWSMKYADGTAVSSFRPEDVDTEKMKWLDGVLKHYMADLSARMREIKTALQRDTPAAAGGEGPDGVAAAAAAAAAAGGPAGASGRGDDQAAGADLAEREALLDELMDIVSSIDYARDLHKIGGLPVLMELLSSPHPSLQWRAAEVVATCVANNPPVQQWFLEGGVLPELMRLAAPSETDGTVRTKALLALSGLVRHFGPGLQAFREAGGLALLVGGLGGPDRRVTRKATTLLTYLLSQRRADCAAAVRDGALPPLVAELATGGSGGTAAAAAADGGDAAVAAQEESDMRQAALGALLQMASYPGTWAAVRDAPGLRGRLEELAAAHQAMSAEEREAQEEEMGLLTQLGGLLAAAAPPPAGPDDADHVSVEAFEEAGRGTTFEVNALAAAVAAAAAKGTGSGDAGAGAGDQGGAPAASAAPGGGSASAAAAAPPLLLGAP